MKIICLDCKKEFVDETKGVKVTEHNRRVWCDKCVDRRWLKREEDKL